MRDLSVKELTFIARLGRRPPRYCAIVHVEIGPAHMLVRELVAFDGVDLETESVLILRRHGIIGTRRPNRGPVRTNRQRAPEGGGGVDREQCAELNFRLLNRRLQGAVHTTA